MNAVRVTITPRKECRCIVKLCPANRGADGCTCEYAYLGIPCEHPLYRDQWHDRGAYYPHLVEAEPPTLTARVAAARRAGQRTTPEAARAKIEQLGLGMEV